MLTNTNIVGRRVRCKKGLFEDTESPVFKGDEGVVFSFSLRYIELRFPWRSEHTKRMREAREAQGKPFLGEAAFIFSFFGISAVYDIKTFELSEGSTDKKRDDKAMFRMLRAFFKDFTVLEDYVPKNGGLYEFGPEKR